MIRPAALRAPIVSTTDALDQFQDALHDAVQAFVNGDFVVPGSRRLALLRPLRLEACRVPWDLLEAATAALPCLTTAEPDAPVNDARLLEDGRRRGWLAVDEAAAVLAFLLRVLDRCVNREQPRAASTVRVLRVYDASPYRARGMAAVERLASCVQRTLTPYVRGFYLHGSLSTLDATGYSDLDDFVIITREAALSAEALRECAARCIAASRYLYEHDVWQHHRHYVVTEIDLARYAPAYLPPEVLRFATAIVGPRRLAISLRDSSAADRRNLLALVRELSRWDQPGAEADNLWQLKSLLSAVLLLPALYLGASRRHCYKKFSFELARRAFGLAWSPVELASELRRTWDARPTLRERLLRRLMLDGLTNPMLLGHIMARWAQPVPIRLRSFLRDHDFYRMAAALGLTALRLLDGPPGEG